MGFNAVVYFLVMQTFVILLTANKFTRHPETIKTEPRFKSARAMYLSLFLFIIAVAAFIYTALFQLPRLYRWIQSPSWTGILLWCAMALLIIASSRIEQRVT